MKDLLERMAKISGGDKFVSQGGSKQDSLGTSTTPRQTVTSNAWDTRGDFRHTAFGQQ